MQAFSLSTLKRDHAHSGEMHSHDEGQLFIMQSGLMAFETEEAHWAIPIHHAGWVPPGAKHNAQTFGPTSALSLYLDPKYCTTLPQVPCVFKPGPLLLPLVQKLGTMESAERKPQCLNLLHVLVDELFIIKPDPLFIPLPKSPVLLKMTQSYISNPAQKLSLEAWADRLHLSKRTLTRAFRQELGMSVNQWCQHLKLVKGCELLATGHSVTETAYTLGCENVCTFINLFKKYLKVTPKQYRFEMKG